MSSDSDRFVFQQALEEQDNSSLFQAKRWTYVTDSSSTNGQFSGQIQFDLNTLSSQNQWTDLSQGYIQFPVKLTIKNNDANTNDLTASVRSACIKDGFHNFVDSVQLVLGGSTIQTSQIYTNVDTTFKVLTEWSQNELRKWGPSLGLALDDYLAKDTVTVTTDGTAQTNLACTVNSTGATLDNVTAYHATTDGNLYNRYGGADLMASWKNKGLKERTDFLNTDVTTTSGASAIITNLNTKAKGNVSQTAGFAKTNFCAFYLATVKLNMISDAVAKLPPIKNLKGYLYVNYNAATSTYTSTATTGIPSGAMQNSAQFGRCQPAMISRNDTHGACSITFQSEISGATDATLTTAKPAMTNARLTVPYYVASPEVDRALAQKKTIRYNERFVTTVPIDKLSATQTTLTPGIMNPKRLIMLPILYGDGSSASIAGALATPELSPLDIAGCGGSSAFATLEQLQVMVGNQPLFQQPISMDHDMFMNEVCQIGLDGGLNYETGSGLLSQKLWNQHHKFYTVDIGRRINGDDGASKSIQIHATNPCNLPMRLICIIWHEREIEVDTSLCVITQGV